MAEVWISALVQAKAKIQNCRIPIGYLQRFAPTLKGLRMLSYSPLASLFFMLRLVRSGLMLIVRVTAKKCVIEEVKAVARKFLKPSIYWLLVFLPLAVWTEHARPESQGFIFIAACLAIIPLAAVLGHATEHIASRVGEGLGGLLNATFGNAAELIIAIVALQAGKIQVVKASLTGSIIGNILLVLGASFLAGGIRHKVQKFNPIGMASQTATLSIAAIALIVPTAFHAAGVGRVTQEVEWALSLAISLVLFLVYFLSLIFSLRTHTMLFNTEEISDPGEDPHIEKPWSIGKSALFLVVSSALIAWMSELLVGSVEQASHAMGMSQVFVGVIVVAVVGNAAEHSTAILMAIKNRISMSLGIALGSSIQIAIFVAPLLVLLSYAIAEHPIDLVFSRGEVIVVFFTAFIANQVVTDGKSTWFDGVQLLAVYTIVAIAFYFIP
jgi:Ca2+:H+ antiporter